MSNEPMTDLKARVFDSLTDDQKKKAAAYKSDKEILDFLGAEGVELPDDALDAVAGGCQIDVTPKEGEETCKSCGVYKAQKDHFCFRCAPFYGVKID